MGVSSDPAAHPPEPITPAQLELIAPMTVNPLALYRVEGPGRYRVEWVDPRALAKVGHRPDDVVGRLFGEVFPAHVTARFHEHADRAVRERQTVRYLGTTRLHTIQIDLEIALMPIFVGEIIQLVTTTHDIGDYIAVERERDATERRLRKLTEHAADMIWLVDGHGTIRHITSAVEHHLGYAPDDVVGRRAIEMVPDDVKPTIRALATELATADLAHPVRRELPLLHRDASPRWMDCTFTNLLDDPDIGAIVVNAHDVTQRKVVEERLAHDARHDSLTGLPNRTLVSERITAILQDAPTEADGDAAALLYLDFDGFKLVNDTFGHDQGDVLICEAATRLVTTVGERGWVARLGGDEFLVVSSRLAPVEHHLGVADDIRLALARPFVIGGTPVYLTVSTGIAIATTTQQTEPLDASEMLRRADMAMYEAKRRSHDSIQLFDESLRARAEHRLATRTGLRHALERGELRVEYQPIFSNATRTVVGVEALLRWDHPEHGVVLPAAFVDIAEETGLIVPIGARVFDEACRQLAEWDRRGYARVHVAVNVSPRQLLDPGFVEMVRGAIARANIDPCLLVIEITESLLMEDPRAARDILRRLARAGVSCAIDDFGIGYSSLSYLANLPARMLKIDRTFVALLGDRSRAGNLPLDQGTALVGAIIGMAHALGLEVVAEGVESEAQLVELRRLGCEYAQGYHLARPAPPGAVEQRLRRRLGVQTHA